MKKWPVDAAEMRDLTEYLNNMQNEKATMLANLQEAEAKLARYEKALREIADGGCSAADRLVAREALEGEDERD